jgi:DNA (cytosine-5)-methyltransferase 1
VCSGIEAATVAWHPLGWEPVAFSEIEKFPSKVLAHHYPDVPNLGDMTKYEEWNFGAIDLFVGGTPCQSFSVAGLRKGLDDPRGNLMLTFGAIANRFRPRWLVWENVPGVLSSNGGRDFGSFLGMLGKLGYGFAYRVLDAQYFGVAQRRRRVFVVGYFGNWRRAAAVLFERHGLQGHPAPSRETRKEVTSFTPTSIGGYSEGCGTLRANGCDIGGGSETLVAAAVATTQFGCVAGSLTARYDSSACADRGMNVVAQPIGFNARQDPCSSENLIGSIDTDGNTQAVAFGVNEKPDVAHCLRSGASKADKHESTTYAVQQMAVRRLTPVECERLQGFPDNYTNIPKAVDGPRYKALGNSMAVPVMGWIGKRIQMVDA